MKKKRRRFLGWRIRDTMLKERVELLKPTKDLSYVRGYAQGSEDETGYKPRIVRVYRKVK